jgi:hypothetical protein
MWQCMHVFRQRIVADDVDHEVQAWGIEREDGRWEGRLVFVPEDGGPVLCTERETTQSTLDALRYWASGLEPVYLEGAFDRAAPVRSLAFTPVILEDGNGTSVN